MTRKSRYASSKGSKDLSDNSNQLKLWIANEAARIYVSEKTGDIYQAKLKAAQRLGIDEMHGLPSNDDVELAIKSYQALFNSSLETQSIQALQQQAITAMHFFAPFKPRLVGSLVNGTATSHSTLYLHLFADHAEAVDWFLIENKLPHEAFNKIYYLNNQKKAQHIPAYRFIAQDTPIELAVFPEVCLRQPVRCSPKGSAIVRESLARFQERIGRGLISS